METTSFMEVYSDPKVKAFIHRAATRRSAHDPSFWDDLVAEGWIGISLAPPDKTHKCYCQYAFRAIESAWQRSWRAEQHEREALRRILEQIEAQRID